MFALLVSLLCLVILVVGSLINLIIDEIPDDLETPLFIGGNLDVFA